MSVIYNLKFVCFRLYEKIFAPIRNTLNNIDWNSSEIRLVQQKTEIPIALPLDNETGNAIADYILNGRPDSACNNIFLRAVKPCIALNSLPHAQPESRQMT